jgi:DNA processing protein
VVAWCDADYPPGLRELFDPPPALYLRGHEWRKMLRALRLRPTVAVVGARRPSPYGLEMAWLLGGGLARAGVNVVSGMALGIDAQAHVGALDGLDAVGATDRDDVAVALAGVLGAGVRLAVPRTNAELFKALEGRGLLLSEYGWLLPPHPWHFPARNRVIAALADAVVIVEGDARSGALHTAAFAVDLGRDVLAVPGEAGRPLSAGPHRLLRDGAHLCEAPDDVLGLLPEGAWRRSEPPLRTADRGLERDPDGPDLSDGRRQGPEARVLAALARGRHTADQLQQALGLTPAVVAAALSALEIDGLLEVQPGGRYRARRDGRRTIAR